MNDFLTDLRRRNKARHEHYYLLDVNEYYNELVCHLQKENGGNEYEIRILNYDNLKYVEFCCDCKDFTYRNQICKHIYWLGYAKMGEMDPCYWTQTMMSDFCHLHKATFNIHVGRNDTCPICVEPIDYTSEKTICCIRSCYNSAHSKCWLKYYIATLNPKCVFCRQNL